MPLRIRIRPVLPVLHGRLGRLMAAVTAFEVGNVAATLLILRATQLLTPAGVPRLGAAGPVRVLTAGVALFAPAYARFATTGDNPIVLSRRITVRFQFGPENACIAN